MRGDVLINMMRTWPNASNIMCVYFKVPMCMYLLICLFYFDLRKKTFRR